MEVPTTACTYVIVKTRLNLDDNYFFPLLGGLGGEGAKGRNCYWGHIISPSSAFITTTRLTCMDDGATQKGVGGPPGARGRSGTSKLVMCSVIIWVSYVKSCCWWLTFRPSGYCYYFHVWGCATRFPKPLPYLWPKSAIFPALIMTWPKIRHPIYNLVFTSKSVSDLRYN